MDFHFDSSPTIYFGLVYLMLFAWIFATIWQKPKQSDSIFLLIGSLFLFFLRLPIIRYNKGINQDEGQMLTQAMTLRQDPILFQSVDTTTGGPLSSYLLTFFNLIGFRLDYSTAHLVAILLIISTFIILYKTCQKLFDTNSTRFAIIPFIIFESLTQEPDFVHFASELMPLLMISLMLYFYSKKTLIAIFFIGFLAVLLIFGKLQAILIGTVIGLWILIESFKNKDWKAIYYLIGGGISCLILSIGLFTIWGVLGDVIDFYFIRNLTAHSAERPLYKSIFRIPQFLGKDFGFLLFFIVCITKPIKFSWKSIGFSLILLLISLFSVIRTGSEYLHYLHLLIPALVLWAAHHSVGLNHKFYFVIILIVAGYYFGNLGFKTIKNQPTNAYSTQSLTSSNVSKEILKNAQSGEKLVVWGWNLDFHIETQMPQGTRENHIPYIALLHKFQKIEQQRYLADLKQNQPKIFVDAVGVNSHWFNDKSKFQHENYPEIKEFIEKNYILTNFVDDVRIYKRVK